MSVKFHFFGTECQIDRALSNRSHLQEKLGEIGLKPKNILLLNQIHSAEVVVITQTNQIYGEQSLPKADAIVTNIAEILVGVVTADCAPILFYDSEEKIIAATHAGWRGAKLGVIENTISAMRKLGAKKIQAQLGPMIQQSSYEVGKEFFEEFLAEAPQNKIFFQAKSDEKFHFDLHQYVINKIKALDVAVSSVNIDTYIEEKNFFSFRRTTHLKTNLNKDSAEKIKDCGRNISVIMCEE